jgi:simple sugar transport system substrate-binding protein
MLQIKRFLMVLILAIAVTGVVAAEGRGEAAAEAGEVQYTFYYVSHIGPADPNMKWLTISSDDFMAKFPEVKIVYVADEEFSVKKQVENLKKAVATNPDGLIVPITDA